MTTEKQAIARMNAYSEPLADGGLFLNTEAMLWDLIAISKGAGCPSVETFVEWVRTEWDEIPSAVLKPPSSQIN